MTLTDEHVRERLVALEIKVGDSSSGILGEIQNLRKTVHAVEIRLAGLMAAITLISHWLSK